jgi:hypothetical protein
VRQEPAPLEEPQGRSAGPALRSVPSMIDTLEVKVLYPT